MPEHITSPLVDGYLNGASHWREEMEKLREIALSCGLDEELKWGKPCYMYGDGNVAIIGPFKDYCMISFVQGALLKDSEHILVQQTEHVQAARVVKFTSVSEIERLEPVLKAYLMEAIEAEKAGLKVDTSTRTDITAPEELEIKFQENPGLKAAFYALTPGRQRGYLLHFSQPKQSKTRTARIEKCEEKILAGKGMDD